MSLLAAGITKDVIRDIMPPYSFDPDLLAGAVGILPPPPPDASASWRQARLRRLVREISVLVPADATQAKLAVQLVVFRETADDTLGRANLPGLTVEQVCRVRRAAADLTRTSVTLERALSRRQELPAAFFGTVLGDEVDIPALDAVWCKAAPAERPGGPAVGAAGLGAAAAPQAAAPAAAAEESLAPEPGKPEPAAPEPGKPESAAPESAAADSITPESAASDPAARGTETPGLAAEIVPAGLEPEAFLTAGIASTGRVSAGFVPVALDPAGLDPAGPSPGSESAPQATPVSDPTVRTMAGLPGGSAAPMHDGRMEVSAT